MIRVTVELLPSSGGPPEPIETYLIENRGDTGPGLRPDHCRYGITTEQGHPCGTVDHVPSRGVERLVGAAMQHVATRYDHSADILRYRAP